MDETSLALVETLLRVITLGGYGLNAAVTGTACFLWINARTPAEIGRAQSQTLRGILIIAIYAMALHLLQAITPTMGKDIEIPKTPSMMIPACFAVIAAFSARDPKTHTLTWTAAALTGLAISILRWPGHPGIIALLGMLIIGAHATTILAARVIRIGPARSFGPAGAATLLGLDTGIAAYAALSVSILQG